MGIQAMVSQLVSQMADFLPVGYAFGAGMVSAVNPCGFFLLPVYMSLYLGAEEQSYTAQTLTTRVVKATWVSVIVTLGFGLLFGLVGAAMLATGYYLMQVMPWFAVVIGVLFILLGGWVLTGRTISLPLAGKLVDRLGDFRQVSTPGYFLFGLAFGITSLGCTLPIFMAVVGSSFTADGYMSGLGRFLSYILGMGLVMHMLTLGMALVKKRLVLGLMRRVVPYISTLSALFLLTAGGYILYYWFSSGLLLSS